MLSETLKTLSEVAINLADIKEQIVTLTEMSAVRTSDGISITALKQAEIVLERGLIMICDVVERQIDGIEESVTVDPTQEDW